MPKLKQPVSLRDAAMDSLVVLCANYCDDHSTKDSLEKICKGVDFMKQEICTQLPPQLDAEFCYEFVHKFLWSECEGFIERPKSHIQAVTEILMGRKFIGFICPERLTLYLDPDHVNRIIGLAELYLSRSATYILANYCLEDLRVLVYQSRCTDSDLEVIGENCRKLVRLDFRDSRNVTDMGLRALSPCSNLRSVLLLGSSCTTKGIIELLAANTRIRKLLSRYDHPEGGSYHFYSLPNSPMYPSIESFTIDTRNCHTTVNLNDALQCISVKFPNLKSLSVFVNGDKISDLKLPHSLSLIPELELIVRCFTVRSNEFQNLFNLIGANLKKLSFVRGDGTTRQIDLDCIFKFCPNLEELTFRSGAERYGDKLAIPEFEKLKIFTSKSGFYTIAAKLEFGKMCALEELQLDGNRIFTLEELKSIILDHVKFPNLKVIRLFHFANPEVFRQLRKIVKVNNLDLELKHVWQPEVTPYDSYMCMCEKLCFINSFSYFNFSFVQNLLLLTEEIEMIQSSGLYSLCLLRKAGIRFTVFVFSFRFRFHVAIIQLGIQNSCKI